MYDFKSALSTVASHISNSLPDEYEARVFVGYPNRYLTYPLKTYTAVLRYDNVDIKTAGILRLRSSGNYAAAAGIRLRIDLYSPRDLGSDGIYLLINQVVDALIKFDDFIIDSVSFGDISYDRTVSALHIPFYVNYNSSLY